MAFLFVCPYPAFAVMTMSFSGLPSSINQDEEFTIQTSLSGASNNPTTYYFRAAFYVDGTTQYFGYTYNNQGVWNNSPSDYKQFYQINTGTTGSFSGPIKVKADLLNNYFKGSGEYQFKIGRYTEGGSGPTWSDPLATTIIGPTPIPPTATPTPQSTPTLEPTSSPIPTTLSRPTNLPKSTATPTSPVLADAIKVEEDTGLENNPTIPPLMTDAPKEPVQMTTEEKLRPFIPAVLIFTGAILMLACGTPLLVKKIRSRLNPPTV